MTDLEILARILLALGFGAILGLETETRTTKEGHGSVRKAKALLQRRIGGVRTYTVLALFGAVGGILFSQGYPLFAYLMFTAVFLIVLAAYIMNIQLERRFGMTTELAILITVLVGFAATSGIVSLQILLIVIVLLAFILSQKRGIELLTGKIAHEELQDVVKFAIVTIVVFPFLPNEEVYISSIPGLFDFLSSIGVQVELLRDLVVLNPFRLWQYVVLISGFNLLGYFANRIFGSSKGLLLTGMFGGFVSSTSTTVALAARSVGEKAEYMWRNLGGVALIANAVSFAQILVLAASASIIFFSSILSPSIAMVIGSLGIAVWFMSRSRKDVKEDIEIENQPYSIGPALKFAGVLILVRLIVQVVNFYMGDSAFILVTALSGLLGMDFATITLGELVQSSKIGLNIGLITFLLANGVNFVAKIFYSYIQGARDYARVVAIGLLVTFLLGALGVAITLLGV
jgi:uncharacterized membrane protein (DUF4010 family)